MPSASAASSMIMWTDHVDAAFVHMIEHVDKDAPLKEGVRPVHMIEDESLCPDDRVVHMIGRAKRGGWR